MALLGLFFGSLVSAQVGLKPLEVTEQKHTMASAGLDRELETKVTSYERKNSRKGEPATVNMVLLSIFDPVTRYSWSGPLWGARTSHAEDEWRSFKDRCKIDSGANSGIACFCAHGTVLWVSTSHETAPDVRSAHMHTEEVLREHRRLTEPAWISIIYGTNSSEDFRFWQGKEVFGPRSELYVTRVEHVGVERIVDIMNERGQIRRVYLTNDLKIAPTPAK